MRCTRASARSAGRETKAVYVVQEAEALQERSAGARRRMALRRALGHDLRGMKEGEVIEEKTLAEISRRSALYAETGATMHAPQNETTVALVDEVRRLRGELERIVELEKAKGLSAALLVQAAQIARNALGVA